MPSKRTTRVKHCATAVLGASVCVSGLTSQAMAQCAGFVVSGGSSDPGFIQNTQIGAAFSGGAALSSIVSAVGVVNTSSLAQTSAFTGTVGTDKPVMQGGVWVREVGGHVESSARTLTQTNSTARSTDTSGGPVNFESGSGSRACDIQNRTSYSGTQLGFDIGRLNVAPGTHIIVGGTTGYTNIDTKDTTPGLGSFQSSMQVPFVGLYATLNSGAFSLDAQVRYDHYNAYFRDFSNTDSTVNQGLQHQNLNGHSTTVIANASYRLTGRNSPWFFEPSAGVLWSQTEFDNLSVTGAGFYSTPSRVQFATIDSLLGRLSGRVGVNIQTPEVLWQPFVVASVFHEFGGDSTATAVADKSLQTRPMTPGTVLVQSNTQVGVTRVGTYGHVGVGIAAVPVDSGWAGFARFDYREGEDIRGYSLSIGGRYQFAGSGAVQSGVNSGAPSVSPSRWTGFYAGLNGSGLFGQTDWKEKSILSNEERATKTTFPGIPAEETVPFVGFGAQVGGGRRDIHSASALGGMQAGYNVQQGTLIYGMEAEWSVGNMRGGRGEGLGNFSNARGSKGCPGAYSHFGGFSGGGVLTDRSVYFDCLVSINHLGLFTARVGTTWEQSFVYLKGGLAVGEVEGWSRLHDGRFGSSRDVGEANWQLGWALGAGIEYALSDTWSIKGEYMHFDLGSAKVRTDSGTDFNRTSTGIIADLSTQGDLARVGVNYRFGAK